jgi:hypothetical protein
MEYKGVVYSDICAKLKHNIDFLWKYIKINDSKLLILKEREFKTLNCMFFIQFLVFFYGDLSY